MVGLAESNTRKRCAPCINGVPFILAGSGCRVLDSAKWEYQLWQVGNPRVFKVLSRDHSAALQPGRRWLCDSVSKVRDVKQARKTSKFALCGNFMWYACAAGRSV
jgi:hypothetical protein